MDHLESIGPVGDELEDLQIFKDMVRWPNPFAGSSARTFALDQARLPFHVTAAVVGITGGPVLPTARAVSVASALLVILLVFLLGRELFDERVGLLAAACQAFSIYDIGFSRFGFTTSSSLFVAGFLLSLLCWHRAITTRQLRWCWLTGIAIGLSMAAKLFGVFTLFLVACWVFLWPRERVVRRWSLWPRTPSVRRLLRGNLIILCNFAGLACFTLPPRVELVVFLFTTVLAVMLHWTLIRRARGRIGRESAGSIGLVLATCVVIYFFVGSPEHLDVQRIAQMLQWIPRWHNAPFPAAPFTHTTLWDFVTILLVRLNIPFNLLWLAALGANVACRRNRSHRLLLLAFGIPFAILSLSRWKVTWYLLMVFPICYLMIAALIVRMAETLRRRHAWLRAAAVAGLLASAGWYGRQLVVLHPYEEIDGYRLGRTFIGWSAPSFVTFEGIPAIAAWMDAHLPYAAEVACIPILHPVYNKYAFRHLLRYRRNPWILYRAAPSLQNALGAPYILTSLFSAELAEPLEAAGYRPVQTFWLKGLAYGTLYATAEAAKTLGGHEQEQPSGRR